MNVYVYVRWLKQDCAFSFNNEMTSNGTFMSPNFPGVYPRDVQCHYLFYGVDKSRVYVTFSYFDVDGMPPRYARFHAISRSRCFHRVLNAVPLVIQFKRNGL